MKGERCVIQPPTSHHSCLGKTPEANVIADIYPQHGLQTRQNVSKHSRLTSYHRSIPEVMLFIVIYLSHTDVLQPVCLVNRRVPASFIDGGVNDIFHLPQRFPHDVDVGDFQEVQLYVGVEGLTFISSILCLHKEGTKGGETSEEEEGNRRGERLSLPLFYLVGTSNATLTGIEDGELVRLSVGVHDDLEEAFVLFTAAIRRSD